MKRFLAAFLLAGCAPAPPPPPTATAPPPPPKPGQSAFETTCAVCHQAGGTGLPGTFPPLAGSEWATGDPEIPIAIVLRGAQGPLKVGANTYNSSMPPQALKDDQIAEILTYVRSSWGNTASAVTPVQVAAVRKRLGSGDPWSESDLRKAFPKAP